MNNTVSLPGVPLDRIKKFMRSSASQALVGFLCLLSRGVPCSFIYFSDIAAVGKKVITFYKKKGGEVVSPMVKAL